MEGTKKIIWSDLKGVKISRVAGMRGGSRKFNDWGDIIYGKYPPSFSLLFSTQTQSNDPVQCAFTPTTKLQALSVITLAKMCLQNEDMAKRVVPAFGHLLDTTKDAALKNNIMYALSDMCVRYASLGKFIF